ncbi:MAG TPA: hypothetical protein VHE32_05205 [Rhodanobacteraceae bacterium]|nr:hypothetical protein [Rhodanobacteraceae bacterium]
MHCTRRIPFLLAAVVLATSVTSPCAVAATRVLRVDFDRQAAMQSPRIRIGGTAAAGCLPRVERVTADGADLSVELAAAATGCRADRPIPFHLAVDSSSAAALRGLSPQVYRVRVYSGSASNPQLIAFSLLDLSTSVPTTPESGFWWTQAGADRTVAGGTGASFEVQDNQLAVGLLGFGDTGAATWSFGSATLGGHTAKVSLVRLSNGDPWFAPVGVEPDVQSAPRLEIEFLSPSRARAYLVRTNEDGSAEVREVLLARSAFSAGPAGTAWAGRWVLIPEDGGAPRLFELGSPTHRDTESFRLVDAAGDAELDCRLVTGSQQADACALSVAGAPVADFDQVGYDRLSGRDAGGMPIQLLRVPR